MLSTRENGSLLPPRLLGSPPLDKQSGRGILKMEERMGGHSHDDATAAPQRDPACGELGGGSASEGVPLEVEDVEMAVAEVAAVASTSAELATKIRGSRRPLLAGPMNSQIAPRGCVGGAYPTGPSGGGLFQEWLITALPLAPSLSNGLAVSWHRSALLAEWPVPGRVPISSSALSPPSGEPGGAFG